MQNTVQIFRQSSIVSEKPGILSEHLKILTSSNYPTVQYFFAETLHTFFTYQCLQERVWDFFYFIQILSYLQKLKKRPDFYPLFTLLHFYWWFKVETKLKKSYTRFCRHYKVENLCKISAKNIKLYGRWSSLKFSIFQTKNLVSWK